jgi:hypothetical protein
LLHGQHPQPNYKDLEEEEVLVLSKMLSESEEHTLSEDEDKAQSTLGKQSALVSMLNMGIFNINM